MLTATTEHRHRLIGTLETLTPAQWDAPTLCDGWSVGHVVAHITMPLRLSVPAFLFELARAGGRFHVMSDRVAHRDGALPPDELIARLREQQDNPWTPPGGGELGALTHDVVHGLDVTVALGMPPVPRPEECELVLEGLTSTRSRRHFGVDLDGVELRSTDVAWSTGSGEPIVRPAHELIVLLAGRRLPDGTQLGHNPTTGRADPTGHADATGALS